MFGQTLLNMFKPTPLTPTAPSPPTLDRRNSDPHRAKAHAVLPGTASVLLSRVASVTTRQSTSSRDEAQSPSAASFNDDRIEWETLSRRGSDPSQCGYLSFPDFDRLTSTSGSRHDGSS